MWVFLLPTKTATGTEPPRTQMSPINANRPAKSQSRLQLPVSVDMLAVGIALALAALIRFGVIHQINF